MPQTSCLRHLPRLPVPSIFDYFFERRVLEGSSYAISGQPRPMVRYISVMQTQLWICILDGPEDDSLRIETCCLNNTHNKVPLCLTDTSLYIYICVEHFGMGNVKKKVMVSVGVVNWELQVETGKNRGRVDSLSQ